jgi:hypothetical protein
MRVIKKRLFFVEIVDLNTVFIAVTAKMSILTREQGAGIRYAALNAHTLQN